MKFYLPPIFGIIGPQGSGKSFSTFKLICEAANELEYDLCFNFTINLEALYYYCLDSGYYWLLSRILHNKVRCRFSEELDGFMDLPKTIYVMDEAGVYMNSREFQRIPKKFLHDLAQVRHDSKVLVWCAQYSDMVDRVLRELTAGYCQCLSTTKPSKKLGNYELYWQRLYIFNSRQYRIFLNKVDSKLSGFKFWMNARRLADFHYEGLLSDNDRLIFDIYSSFGARVGEEYGYIDTDDDGNLPVKLFNSFPKVVNSPLSDWELDDLNSRLSLCNFGLSY